MAASETRRFYSEGYRFAGVAGLMWGLICFAAGVAHAHPYHTSTAHVELDRETQRLQVGLRVAIADLEEALSARLAQTFRVCSSAQVETEVAAYVGANLQFRAPGSEPLPLLWVGKEVDQESAWLYFEVALAEIDGARLSMTLFHEVHPEHIATVTFVDGERQRTMCFSRKTASQEVQLSPPSRGESGARRTALRLAPREGVGPIARFEESNRMWKERVSRDRK
ncbi:MAG: DUF6702 family protein [Planctomycetota bacterium]